MYFWLTPDPEWISEQSLVVLQGSHLPPPIFRTSESPNVSYSQPETRVTEKSLKGSFLMLRPELLGRIMQGIQSCSHACKLKGNGGVI